MSRQRFRIILLFNIIIVVAAGYGYFRSFYWQREIPRVRSYDSSLKSPANTVRIIQRGAVVFLVDTETEFRISKHNERLVNPMFLNAAEMVERADIDILNPWPAFQKLYLRYYGYFYRDRMNKNISPFDREVNLAYRFWQNREKTLAGR